MYVPCIHIIWVHSKAWAMCISKSGRIPLTYKLLALLLLVQLAGCASHRPGDIALVEANIADLQAAILSGRTRCETLVGAYIRRIEAYDQPRGINAITVVNPNALAAARRIDAAIARGEPQPELFCAPILVKDNFDTYDMATTGGSIALIDSQPPDDAYMVRRLREAGAIILAKTNMGEWAFSPRETLSSSYGRTANAYDPGFVPAGSSGGTASAVAASFGVAGMGTDTGNSIRGPSSHLALFGMRSTLGLTSRDGVIPLVFDRDIAGPMTRTVTDGVKLFNVIAGFDPADPLTLDDRREVDYRIFLNAQGLRGKRLGVFRRLADPAQSDPEILLMFEQALADLEAAGATLIDPFSIPGFDEISASIPYCGRFRHDMRRYLQSLNNPPLLDVNEVLASGQLTDASRIEFEFYGGFPLETPPEEWDVPCPTWPNHPQRNQLLASTAAAMDAAGVDALVYPTWTYPPAAIDRASADYRGDNSQLLVPDAGLPAVTVPMGFWQGRLPIGLQISGRPYAEGILIEIAYAYEQRTQHRRPPEGFEELARP